MNFIPNNWSAIRSHYSEITPLIMKSPVNEWATDPYAWDGAKMINLTPIETWLWSDIRACDAVLYPQYPVLSFFVDFANPKAKVAIECDGSAYHQDKAKDAARDKKLADAGWTVYRISGSDCRKECDEITGALSIPHLFIQRICDIHGISRNSQEHRSDADDGWESTAEGIDRWWRGIVAMRKGGAA